MAVALVYRDLPHEINPETGRRRVVGIAPPQFEKTCRDCNTIYKVYSRTGAKQGRCVECRTVRHNRRTCEASAAASARKDSYYWRNKEKHRAQHRKWREGNAAYLLWYKAKRRAEEKGLAFDIEVSDVVIPAMCPVLGIAMASEKAGSMQSDGCPTLDKIDPSLGYVKGNVAVISWRANKLKGNGTLDELSRIADWLKVAITCQR